MIDFDVLNRANDLIDDLKIEAVLDTTGNQDRILIRLQGVLGHLNTVEFADRIIEFFQGDWKGIPIIIDLKDLQYISSSGIGTFTTIRMQADHKNSDLYLLKMNQKVRQVFDQLGFSSFFRLIDSLEELQE